jgi:hypothetical protein
MPALSVLAHHTEPADPELLRWLIHTIDSILGLGPLPVVLAIAIVIAAFPLGLGVLAVRQRRGARR